MKKNKKLLLSILALNSIVGIHSSASNSTQIKYEKLYSNIVKNLEIGKSNEKNYKLIEEVLNKRNRELKDLYFQNDYIVKPEYLEWQIFFNGFYAKKNRGDDKDYMVYNENGELVSSKSDSANGRDLRTKKLIQIGATIPIKTVKDFSIDPKINLVVKDVEPILITAPVIKMEKTLVAPLPVINDPIISAPSLSLNISPQVSVAIPNVDFSFTAGHNAGAPPGPLAGYTSENVVTRPTGVATSGDFTKTNLVSNNSVWRFSSIGTAVGTSRIIAPDVSLTATNTKDGNGFYTFENGPGAVMISILGTVRILENSQTNYVVGDTVDGDARATTYNGGTMEVFAAQTHKNLTTATDTPSGGGAMMFIPTNYNEPGQLVAGANSNKYLVNGEDGTIHIKGFGNYGILNIDMDHTVSGYSTTGAAHNSNRFGDTLNPAKFRPNANGEVDINIILNQGTILVEKTQGAGNFDSQYGNVALSAFTQEKPLPVSNMFNAYQGMIFDNTTFMYNEGTIKSASGNNMLLQHKGSGQMINNGVLDILSNETIGMIRENTGHRGYNVVTSNTSADYNKWDAVNATAKAVNDGIINISSSAANVLGIKGIGYDGNNVDDNVNSRHLVYDAESKILVKNGDGLIGGIDIDENGDVLGSHYLDVDRSNINAYGANMGGLVPNLSEHLDEQKVISFTLNGKNYQTKDGVIFVGGNNTAGMYVETKNALSKTDGFSGNGLFNPNANALPDASHIEYAKAINDIDGKIFVYSSGNNSNQYSIGAAGQYAVLENKGGIFLGLLPQAGMISSSASGITSEGAVTSPQEQYIGMYGNGSSVTNANGGIITDKETQGSKSNYSKNAIGIFVKSAQITNGTVGNILNIGNITLGEGGKGIVGIGTSNSNMIPIISSGNIEVKGSSDNIGVGIFGKYSNSDLTDSATGKKGLSGNINILGENTIGIFLENSSSDIHDINILGTNTSDSSEVKKSFGIVSKIDSGTSMLKIGNKVKIELKGEKNIGIFGESLSYINDISGTNKADYIDIKLGNGGIGIYLDDIKNDALVKVKSINTGNSSTDQISGGISLRSTNNKLTLETGNIEIGSSEVSGEGFGVYLSGGVSKESTINSDNITVNQSSGVGIFGKNVFKIEAGDIKAGKTGVYQENTAGTAGNQGSLKTGNISLIGNEDKMIGVYAVGIGADNIINVEIGGLQMQNALVESTGLYVKNGGFKNTGNILINAGDRSFGVYIQGNDNSKNVDFGSGITTVKLGDDSVGAYFKNTTISNMLSEIEIGDTTGQIGTQSGVGIFIENTTVLNPIITNVVTGNKAVGNYFGANSGNITYNGNLSVGENTTGIYKNGGILTRDPSKSTIFSGVNNASSLGYYLENSTLDFSSNALNANTLKMNNGIAFLLKGAGAKVTINGVNITNEDLNKLGLDPKVERFVYSDKEEIVTEDITLDELARYYGYHTIDGRLEINGNIFTSNNILTTYGVLAQGRYSTGNEEVLLKNGKVIDMTNSIGSIAIEALGGARVKNEGTIKVGLSNSTSSGIGILGESSTQSPLVKTEIENSSSGRIEISDSGIGIYLDSAEMGGDIINNGVIKSDYSNTVGVYSKLSNPALATSIPSSVITNTGSIELGDDSFGIFSENTKIENSGNILVGKSVLKSAVGIYANNKSEINNTGGLISIGKDGVGFYIDNSKLNITSGSFSTNDGILAYAANESHINYSANGTTLGSKIGFYIDNSTADFNGKDFNVLDNGVGMYITNSNSVIGKSAVKSIGTLSLGSNSIGLYLKDSDLKPVTLNSINYTLGGTINILGENSSGIVGVNSEINNTTNITSNQKGNKGLVVKVENHGTYGVENNNTIELLGDNSIGIYTSALDNNGALSGNINVKNFGTIKLGDSQDINEASIGIFGTEGVSIENNGIITGGKNVVGIYSNKAQAVNNNSINLGDGSVGVYISSGTASINSGSNISVGDNGAVALYASNGGVLVNHATNINVGTDSVIGYAKDAGTVIDNRAALSVAGEAVAFYTNNGAIINTGTLNSTGDGAIYFYSNNGKITNNGQINGAGNKYGVGIYGKSSIIENQANILLGDSYLPYPDDPTNTQNRYAIGIYGDGSEISNSGQISIGENGIGIYSYSQSGDIVNESTGKIISSKDRSTGIFSEVGSGKKVINDGLIDLSGRNSIGIALNKGAFLINNGTIKVSGDNSVGIFAENNSEIHNKGILDISGQNSAAVILRGNSKLINDSGASIILGAGSLGVLTDDGDNVIGYTSSSLSGSGVTPPSLLSSVQTYKAPEIINSGVIKVDGYFEVPQDGVVKVKVDPTTVRIPTLAEITANDHASEDYNAKFLVSSSVKFEADGFNIKDVTVTSDFSQGTNALTYKLENVFMPNTSKAGVTSGIAGILSESYTWDAIPVTNAAGNVDIWMKKIAYEDLMSGLWYEDFGKAMDQKYEDSIGDAGKIFDKIDTIKTEYDFKNIMGSLAGKIYANVNEREDDVARTFENTLDLLQNSSNNTKENVKVSVIGGKGKTTDDTDGVVGYNYNMAGVLALREVERTYGHTFGYSLGYLHTNYKFNDNTNSEELVDTIQIGGHNKYRVNDWVLKNDITGRVSFHDIDRNIMWPDKKSEINGDFETYSITSNNVLGKELSLGKNISMMPYGALRAMYVTRPTFKEDGLEALEVEGNDAWSVKPKLGIELKASAPLGIKKGWELKSVLDIGYEYELANLNVREKARLIAIEDGYHDLAKPEEENGIFRTKASIGVEIPDRYGIFLTGEYGLGSSNQDDYKFGVVLKAVF